MSDDLSYEVTLSKGGFKSFPKTYTFKIADLVRMWNDYEEFGKVYSQIDGDSGRVDVEVKFSINPIDFKNKIQEITDSITPYSNDDTAKAYKCEKILLSALKKKNGGRIVSLNMQKNEFL